MVLRGGPATSVESKVDPTWTEDRRGKTPKDRGNYQKESHSQGELSRGVPLEQVHVIAALWILPLLHASPAHYS